MDVDVKTISLFQLPALPSEAPVMAEQSAPFTFDCVQVMMDHLVDDYLPESFFRPIHVIGYPDMPDECAVPVTRVGISSKCANLLPDQMEDTLRQCAVKIKRIVLKEPILDIFFCDGAVRHIRTLRASIKPRKPRSCCRR